MVVSRPAERAARELLEYGVPVVIPTLVGGAGEAGSGEPEGTGATGVGPYGEGVSQPEGASDSEPGKSPVCGGLGVIVPFVAVAAARRRK
jgi:hypothetical protein